MIWCSPGFPAILVTYGTSSDLFFSGHTAIAVYGAAVLATAFGPVGVLLGVSIALFEMIAVLVLRAHYTMDVFAGAVTALYVHRLAIDWCRPLTAGLPTPLPPWPDDAGLLLFGNRLARRSNRGLFLPQAYDACDDNAQASDHRQNDTADRKMQRVNAILLRGF